MSSLVNILQPFLCISYSKVNKQETFFFFLSKQETLYLRERAHSTIQNCVSILLSERKAKISLIGTVVYTVDVHTLEPNVNRTKQSLISKRHQNASLRRLSNPNLGKTVQCIPYSNVDLFNPASSEDPNAHILKLQKHMIPQLQQVPREPKRTAGNLQATRLGPHCRLSDKRSYCP